MQPSQLRIVACLAVLVSAATARADTAVQVRCRAVDATSGETLPCRVYVRSTRGSWHFVRSASPQGTAVEYRKQRSDVSSEMHTTVSAHPFVATLPPGEYTITAERGKEYLPQIKTFQVAQEPVELKLELRRWIDMAQRGWFSGDTHVHRGLKELPNVVLAEDLNVALPLTNWVTVAYTPPGRGNKNSPDELRSQVIEVDATHVIYPINTEYEIFAVQKGQRHTLGAVFVLNHKTQLEPGVPPVRPVATEARRQGAILDLDKHSWPWSLMIVPVMDVDLFELSNNHHWRVPFHFKDWTIDTNPDYLNVETDSSGFTEWGWTQYGLGVYYTMLNCGFRMRPTAGTASGVHPVPLGFGRVYVQLPDGFSYDGWIDGLDSGRSFVTTGPMLFVSFNDRPPGHTFKNLTTREPECRIRGAAESGYPLDRIEIIVNGEIQQTVQPANRKTSRGGYRSEIDVAVELTGSSWMVVRCFENHAGGRFRFAHSSPVHFDVPEQPLRPRRAEVRYLIRRMQEEIARNQNVLRTAELDEYRQALEIYQRILKRAR